MISIGSGLPTVKDYSTGTAAILATTEPVPDRMVNTRSHGVRRGLLEDSQVRFLKC